MGVRVQCRMTHPFTPKAIGGGIEAKSKSFWGEIENLPVLFPCYSIQNKVDISKRWREDWSHDKRIHQSYMHPLPPQQLLKAQLQLRCCDNTLQNRGAIEPTVYSQ